jgi:hypothetical protein
MNYASDWHSRSPRPKILQIALWFPQPFELDDWIGLLLMLIAVEGCVGSGKSTVARGLASLRGSTLLLEDFESNPFLRDFYADPAANALETEISFLLLHYHQLKSRANR